MPQGGPASLCLCFPGPQTPLLPKPTFSSKSPLSTKRGLCAYDLISKLSDVFSPSCYCRCSGNGLYGGVALPSSLPLTGPSLLMIYRFCAETEEEKMHDRVDKT